MEIKPGMLVRSKAGRDKGHIYVVIDISNGYVYVADGAEKPLCHMKRKNGRHLQPILKVRCGGAPDDAVIRKTIREYAAACRNNGGQ